MTHTSQSKGITWLQCESVPLVRVSPGRRCTVMATGLPRAYMMHWDPELGRTQPCVLVSCPRCQRGIPRRPLSYAPVMHWRMFQETFQWLPAILECPQSTGITLGGLVNKVVELRRDRAFGPVLVGKFMFETPGPKPIKVEMLDHLMALWRLPRNTELVLMSNCVDRVPRDPRLDDEMRKQDDDWCVSPNPDRE